MPIYEYLCPHCKSRFELIRPLSQSEETASCPHCHKEAKRIFSSFFKNIKGSSISISSGSSPCSTCSVTSCATCKMK